MSRHRIITIRIRTAFNAGLCVAIAMHDAPCQILVLQMLGCG